MQKDVKRAERQLAAHASSLCVITAVFCFCAWGVVHAAHAYPGFLARARHSQEDAALMYSRNCQNGVPASQFIDCGNLASERDINVHARAADQTLTHIAEDLNVLRWLGCGRGGWCSRLLEILFSWAHVLLPAVCGLMLFYLYTLARTMESYYNLQNMRAQARLSKQYDPYAAVVNVMKEKM